MIAPCTLGNTNLQHLLDRLKHPAPVRSHVATRLAHLGIDQIAVPETLQHMKGGALGAVQKPQPQHVPVDEVCEGAQTARQPSVNHLFHPALQARLTATAQAGDCVMEHEAVFQIEQIHCLAAGVAVVLVGPRGQRLEVVVDQLPGEFDRRPGDLDVLIHPAVLALAAPMAEQPPHPHRGETAVADRLAQKGHAPAAIDAIDLGAERWQAGADLGDQIGRQILNPRPDAAPSQSRGRVGSAPN